MFLRIVNQFGIKITAVCLQIFLFPSTGWCAPGGLDTSFDSDGIVITDLQGANFTEAGMTVGETVVSPNGVLDIQLVDDFFDVGEHRIQLQVVDDSGNVSPTEEITMTVFSDNSNGGSGGSSIDLMFLMFLAAVILSRRSCSETIERV